MATSITPGLTLVTSGTPNGLLWNDDGVLGNLASSANGVLVTDASGVPSITSTLPPVVFDVGSNTNIRIRANSGTAQIFAANDVFSAATNLLIDGLNINFNSVSGGTSTFTGLVTFLGDLDLPFTAGSVPYVGTSGILSQSNTKLFWDATHNMLGVGTNTPYTDNIDEVGMAVRNDVSDVNRVGIVNRSDNSAAKCDLNLSLGSLDGTGFNYTIQLVTIGGTPYAVHAVDAPIPAFAGIFFAAPMFVIENQLQTENWVIVTSAGLDVPIGSISTDNPSGSTSGLWKLGAANVVSPTSPNRTVTIDIGGTVYYLAAKTTND